MCGGGYTYWHRTGTGWLVCVWWWYWHRTGWYVCVVVGGPVQSALVLGGVRSAETGRPLRWCLLGGVRLTSLGGFTQPPSLVGDCDASLQP